MFIVIAKILAALTTDTAPEQMENSETVKPESKKEQRGEGVLYEQF